MKRILKTLIISLIIVLLIAGFFIFFNPFLVIRLNGERLIEIEYNKEYVDPGFDANIYGKKINDKVVVEGSVDTTKVGSYQIVYKVKSGLTEKQVSRIILVKDNIAPLLTLVGGESINVCPNKEYIDEGYSAHDEYDGDLTDKVIIEKQDNLILYSVKDSSENETKLQRQMKLIDEKKPIITLKGNKEVSIMVNDNYSDEGAVASDNCDGDISNLISVNNDVNITKVGTYKVIYSVKDSSGNEASIERIVKVVEKKEETGWYSNIKEGPTYIKGILIVNKEYSIPSYFGGDNEEANQALYKLQGDANKLGFTAKLVSGYRSYNTQKSTYNYWVSVYGQKDADTISARPGHSEHQTGLAFDITSLNSSYGETEEGIWLRENCSKYGFIIRYPKGKEHITGYAYEPWHIRYVGVEHATYIMKHGLTLEEYLGIA